MKTHKDLNIWQPGLALAKKIHIITMTCNLRFLKTPASNK